MNFGLLPNPWLLLGAAAAVAAAGWLAYDAGYDNGSAAISAEWNDAKDAQRRVDDEDRVRKQKEAERLQREADATESKRNEEKRKLEADVAALALQLRNRPARPAAPKQPEPAGAVSCPAAGTTGAALFAEDAGFLAGEAARAEKLRSALGACYERVDQYEAAQSRLLDLP